MSGLTLRFLGAWNPKKSEISLWEAASMIRYGMWLTQDKSTSHKTLDTESTGQGRINETAAHWVVVGIVGGGFFCFFIQVCKGKSIYPEDINQTPDTR